MQPNNQSGVWISREEYDRLSAGSGTAQSQQARPVEATVMYEEKTDYTLLKVVATGLGIMFFISLTTPWAIFLAPLLITLLMIVGGLSVVSSLRIKKMHSVQKTHHAGGKAMAVIAIIGVLMVFAPTVGLYILGMIIMLPFMILSGGRGT